MHPTTLAETVSGLFEVKDIRAHLFYDFIDNPEGATVTQVGAVRVPGHEEAGVDIE